MVLTLNDHREMVRGLTAAGFVCTSTPTSVTNSAA
jgi:hypothetical protein